MLEKHGNYEESRSSTKEAIGTTDNIRFQSVMVADTDIKASSRIYQSAPIVRIV